LTRIDLVTILRTPIYAIGYSVFVGVGVGHAAAALARDRLARIFRTSIKFVDRPVAVRVWAGGTVSDTIAVGVQFGIPATAHSRTDLVRILRAPV
jgi:hypothetical protein